MTAKQVLIAKLQKEVAVQMGKVEQTYRWWQEEEIRLIKIKEELASAHALDD